MDWKILSSSTRVECSKQSGDDGGSSSSASSSRR